MIAGLDGLTGNLENLASTAPQALSAGLQTAGESLLSQARSLAPVASGELVESGYVRSLDPQSVEVGFAAPYAAMVHERLDVQHETGQAKFLEAPLTGFGQELLTQLADKMKDQIR